MDSKVSLFMDRAQNSIFASQALKKISEDDSIKKTFGFTKEDSFYSSVINHSYYAIFYAAKAYLLSRNIPLKSKQGQHQQVYFEFRKLVQGGEIEKELLRIYEENKLKAEVLLDILKSEKEKRTDFTYETIPQANKTPAEESLNNALTFISHIKRFLGER
ncbi:hypothetical protein A3K73_01995 [Candidatus Pacearchaeota archaeon RBG_13_36_9]|nr:MAG: hypothetical protein A3K73_01995 [Candidatus Pacearchaeota archaeon RBG_13_36_9]